MILEEEKRLTELTRKMLEFDRGDAKRCQHFLKVATFAQLIAKGEELSDSDYYTVLAAALVHDIGIKPAEAHLHCNSGKAQEQEGPAYAEALLSECGYEDAVIKRVSYLVGHHHTYSEIDGADYQILVEADFLTNLYEDGVSKVAAQTALEKIFKTQTGRELLTTMYLSEEQQF